MNGQYGKACKRLMSDPLCEINDLSCKQMTEKHPAPKSNLQLNELEGTFPDFSAIRTLTSLSLSHNKLYGKYCVVVVLYL